MQEMSFLKQMIWAQGMTVQEFADKAGLSKRTLDPYIAGAKQFRKTQFWFAMKVADALEIDPHELLQ